MTDDEIKAKQDELLGLFGDDIFMDFSDIDSVFLYSSFFGQLSDEIKDDPYKLRRLADMVKTSLQAKQIDDMINKQIAEGVPDSGALSKLAAVRSGFQSTISSIATEIGLSKNSSNKAGQRTLGQIMRELNDKDIPDIKVNFISSKMCAAYRQIAEENARALLNELNLVPDDLVEMTAAQSRLISQLSQQNEELTEKLRRILSGEEKLRSSEGE